MEGLAKITKYSSGLYMESTTVEYGEEERSEDML
jgi:hypothetical protein